MSAIYKDLLARAEPFPRLRQMLLDNGHVPLPRRRSACLFDAMARTIVGQQLSNHAAKAIWQRLWQGSGGDLQGLCNKSGTSKLRKLKACGLSSSKIKALVQLQAAFTEGLVREAPLRRMDHASRSEVITSLWGFGQWSADMIAIFYFRDHDVWSPGDLALRRAIEYASNGSIRKQKSIVSAFTPKRSYLCLQLWKGSNNK